MADLNLSPDYFQHPKTRRLVGLLGNGSDVLPLRLWAYCAKYHPKDGRLAGYSAQEIEALVGWWGEPGKCVETLLSDRCRFIHKDADGYRVHDWDKHQGHIEPLRRRAQNAANARWEKERAKARGSPQEVGVLDACSSIAPSNAPNHTRPDRTKPKRGNPPDPLPPLPPELDVPEFVAAWNRWRRHREEIRKPLRPTMAEQQFRQFATWGVAHAIEVIDYTIGRGWIGLQEPEPRRNGGLFHAPRNGNGHPSTRQRPTAAERGEFPEPAGKPVAIDVIE